MHGKTIVAASIAGLFLLTVGVPRAPAWQKKPPVVKLEPIEAIGETESKPAVAPADGEEKAALEEVRSASFQNVRPGETKAAEARKLLGTPIDEDTRDGVTTLAYRIEPFARVDLLITDDVATSLVIHLKRATPAAEIAKDLVLDSFRPAPIPNENGKLIGLAYPERGVTFALVPDTKDYCVSQILLEGVSAEPFVLRAMYDLEHRYESMLADLKYAATLDQQDARIPGLSAQVLAIMGHKTEALAAAALAKKLDPTWGAGRITHAAMLAENGKHAEALAEIRETLALKGLPAEQRAQAECRLANLLVAGPTKNYREAAEHYQAAIKQALPLSTSGNFVVRRAAKVVAVEAHMGMAWCIVQGSWKGKAEVAPKWLARAELLARDYAASEKGDQLLRLRTARKSLAVQAALGADLDPTEAANIAIAEGKRLLEADRDPYFLRQAAWELGQSIHDAARAEQVRGQGDRALEYLGRAIPALELELSNREASEEEEYLLGRLYFVGGSVQALQKDSHAEAIIWFDKAAPLLAAAKAAAAGDKGPQGERLVSMGVSYWETDSRDEALRLTKLGVSLLEEAAAEGTWPRVALIVPYGNLASMHKELGQDTQAQEYAALAAKSTAGEEKRR